MPTKIKLELDNIKNLIVRRALIRRSSDFMFWYTDKSEDSDHTDYTEEPHSEYGDYNDRNHRDHTEKYEEYADHSDYDVYGDAYGGVHSEHTESPYA